MVTRNPEGATVNPGLRPFAFHGVDFTIGGHHGTADCPFCLRDGKLSVDCQSGVWKCWVCGEGSERGGGNALTFLRLLHEQSLSKPSTVASSMPRFEIDANKASTSSSNGSVLLLRDNGTFSAMVARDRRLVDPKTPAHWGVAESIIDRGTWLVPGYGVDGKLDQLYKRVLVDGVWKLLPTPGIWGFGKAHALHLPIHHFDHSHKTVVVCEGPWDGMALWEIVRIGKSTLGPCQVIAVPGCTTWRDEWSELCRDKDVVLMFDSDHPRIVGERTFIAGYDGVQRVAKRLHGIANTIRFLRWGEEGFDPDKPSGWDIRDALSGAPNKPTLKMDRIEILNDLLTQVENVPDLPALVPHATSSRATIEPQHCHSWAECESAWREALQWREMLSDALAVLLAVCASTQQAGNQLFVQLIGSAGSGKTTLCEGLLVSRYCHHLEHLTGFHSGWKGETDKDGKTKDCSLIARINGKTLITPEADILISSPKFTEIMSQQRRIFDGKSGATFKNSSQDTIHTELRTPWIMAGTQALLDTDQSRLGDRFLRLIIDDPKEEEKRSIVRSAIKSERSAMTEKSNGTGGSIIDHRTRRAHAITGGYVDWLRTNIETRIGRIEISEEVEEKCIDLAELSADLRARPNEDKRKREVHDTKELPTRLARQNIRLAAHLAVVLNRPKVDDDIMRIVRRVAFDTAHGHSLSIVQWMFTANPKHPDELTYQETGGITSRTLAVWLTVAEERLLPFLLFMRKIGILRVSEVKGVGRWLLTERMRELYSRVVR